MLLSIGAITITFFYLSFRLEELLMGAILFVYVFYMVGKLLKKPSGSGFSFWSWQALFGALAAFLILCGFYALFWRESHQVSLLEAQFHLVKALLMILPGLAVIFAAALGSGSEIFKWLKIESKTELEQLVLSLALGLASLSYLAFVLAAFHLFTLPVVLVVLLTLILVTFWRNPRFYTKLFTQRVRFTVDLHHPSGWIGLAMFLLLLMIISLHIAGFPIEYDGNTVYVNTAKLIATSGRLWDYRLTGIYPYNLELIDAYGFLLGGMALGMIVNALLGFLGLIFIFVIAERFFQSQAGLVALALLLATPMTTILLTMDGKVDQGLLLFAGVAVYFLLSFIQEYKQKDQKDVRYLALFAFFLGFSLGIKYTAFLMIPASVFTLNFFLLRQQSPNLRKALKCNLTLGLFIFLAFAPWIIRHWSVSGPPLAELNEPGWHRLFFPRPQIQMDGINPSRVNQLMSAIYERDRGGYVRGYSLPDRLWYFWDIFYGRISMYRHGRADLGPNFYITVFLLIYLFIARRLGWDFLAQALFAFVLVYFMAWYIFFFEVSWYAYVGIAFFGILGGAALFKSKLPDKIKHFFYQLAAFLALFHIVFTTLMNTSYFLTPWASIANFTRQGESTISIHSYLINARVISDVINQRMRADKNSSMKVFDTSFHPLKIPMLYIDENDLRVVHNWKLVFNQDLSDEQIRKIFQDLDIQYLLRSEDAQNYEKFWLGDEPVGLIHWEREERFLQKFGHVILKNDHFGLYQISGL